MAQSRHSNHFNNAYVNTEYGVATLGQCDCDCSYLSTGGICPWGVNVLVVYIRGVNVLESE